MLVFTCLTYYERYYLSLINVVKETEYLLKESLLTFKQLSFQMSRQKTGKKKNGSSCEHYRGGSECAGCSSSFVEICNAHVNVVYVNQIATFRAHISSAVVSTKNSWTKIGASIFMQGAV